MSIRKHLHSYLSFSRKDRLGILVFCALILAAYGLPHLFPRSTPPFPLTAETLASLDDSIETLPSEPLRAGTVARAPAPTLFRFDPNTLDSTGWVRLGLRPKTAQAIGKYLLKGGRFRKAEDLQKIYSLPSGFFERVRDSIRIATVAPASPRVVENARIKSGPTALTIDINSADSLAWVALPGIGPRLASRIIAFRSRLGGFHYIAQVKETYGLPDSTFQAIQSYLRLGIGVRKLDLNTSTLAELQSHPYIRWKLARLIIAYRESHGRFSSAEELRNIGPVPDSLLAKLQPYMEVKE